MRYNFSDLIDIEKQQRLLDSFCDAVGIAAAIIDLKGEVLVGSRWQRICTDFHRVNKQTCKKCIESDTQLANELQQGKQFSVYQCRNGLTDAASPIIIEDKHVANVFVGQFLLKAPDREFFLRQAATYGFDEIAYLDALWEVPIVTKENLTAILNFLVIFAEMLAITGLNQLRQTKVKKTLQVNEERLRVTNERLELAMDAGEHGFWDWNVDTNEVFFSPRYYTMLGYENQELPMVLDTWINLMHPEDRKTIVPQIQKYVEHAEPYEAEFRLKCKDGSWRWISGRGKSYELDENGVSHRAVGLHVDITERKRAEEALRNSEKKYRTILETTSEGCWLLNPEVKTIEVNAALCKMLGYSQDEILGKTPFDFVDDENRNIFIEQTSKISDTEHRSYEIVLKKKNGKDLHTYFNATTIRDESGEVLGSFAFVTDITERKQMVDDLRESEEALKESEKKYRSMMEAMTDPAYICSHDFRIEYMNSAMIDKVGRDATGELCHKTIYDEDGKCSWCVFDQVRQGKHTIFEKKDPKTGRFYSINGSFVARSDAPASMLWIYRDITEIKMMEKERVAAEAKFQKALKMESIGTLASGIAHDFNNILSSVIGYTELALDDIEKGSHLEDNLQEVYTASLRAKDLVKQILTFARQADEEFKPVQVDIIVKEALKFLRSSIPTPIKITQNIESDSLIMADPTQVHQIIMNLCTNASQAMDKEGGVLSVGLTDVRLDANFTKTYEDLNPGRYLKLFVSDTGSGISPEVIPLIFEPYFTTKMPGEGTGMGLATVYGIVKNYGGKIMVESEVEKGSTFTVYLPITKKRTRAAPYQEEDLPSGAERILFIDDEAPIAKMGSQILEHLGYSVTARTSSVEALELFRSKPNNFDLVITDMTMPNISGDKLAIELMKIRSDIPVIICTGYSKIISEETALEIGIKAFAYKPVAKADLAKTVRKVLDDQQEEQTTGRILLIDDESEIRKLFIKKLAGKGYEIIEACDGKEGLKLYHETRPDLVITDLVMPEKEGIETIIELKREFPNVKIIAISGGGRNVPGAYLHIAKNLGAERTFSKPIDWPELIKTVRELLK